jgi:hypothetical protein
MSATVLDHVLFPFTYYKVTFAARFQKMFACGKFTVRPVRIRNPRRIESLNEHKEKKIPSAPAGG